MRAISLLDYHLEISRYAEDFIGLQLKLQAKRDVWLAPISSSAPLFGPFVLCIRLHA